MFARPAWFKRRKYMGWGVTPAKWQGWVYLMAFISVIALTKFILSVFHVENIYQIAIMSFLVSMMVIDLIDISFQLKKDEREILHEAIAERNVAWVLVSVLSLGLCAQIIVSIIQQKNQIDPIIVGALCLGLLAKAMSNAYLNDK